MDAGDFQLVDESRCFAAYLWADEAVEDPRDFLDGQGIDIVAGEMFGLERGAASTSPMRTESTRSRPRWGPAPGLGGSGD